MAQSFQRHFPFHQYTTNIPDITYKPLPNGFQRCREWLGTQLPYIATSAEVLAFNRLFKALRHRRKHESAAVQATWVNIAFSYCAFVELQEAIPGLLDDDFIDEAFRQGLATRSSGLNDPPDSADGWVVGGDTEQPLILMQVASDTEEGLAREVARIEDSVFSCRIVNGVHLGSGVRLVYKQNGANLPPPLAGHEHFGFLDGVSQPGIRGLLSDAKDSQGRNIDVLTLRQNSLKRNQPPQKDAQNTVTTPGAPAQGKPGQDLLWPGEFVFGYPAQNPADDPDWDGLNPNPGLVAEAGPKWGRNGSLLVFRRLRQDVGAFHAFLRNTADQYHVLSTPQASAAARVGSLLVGCWASGAPVLRTQNEDLPGLGADDCANNNFEFQGSSPSIPAPPPSDPYACTDNTFSASLCDAAGQICPFSGHIRKAYPRDDVLLPANPGYGGAGRTSPAGCPATDTLNESDTQTHRLLRRGIPYGEVSVSTPLSPYSDGIDRGLLFSPIRARSCASLSS